MRSACKMSLIEAIRKALLECFSSICFIPNYYKSSKLKIEEIRTPSDHAKFYHDPKNGWLIEFLRKGKYITYQELKKKFKNKTIEDLLKTIGGEFYCKNISSEYAKSLDIHVARVLSTELVPIWFGNKCLPFNKKRIKDIYGKYKHLAVDKLTNNKFRFLHPFG